MVAPLILLAWWFPLVDPGGGGSPLILVVLGSVVDHGGSPDPSGGYPLILVVLGSVVDHGGLILVVLGSVVSHGGSPDPGFCGGVVWPGGSPWWILVVLSSGSGLVVPL